MLWMEKQIFFVWRHYRSPQVISKVHFGFFLHNPKRELLFCPKFTRHGNVPNTPLSANKGISDARALFSGSLTQKPAGFT